MINSTSSSKDYWERQEVVKYYLQHFRLQKPEETILKNFRSRLPSLKMLDIGVGAGRTTLYFAPLTKEYVGIDYSENMVNACRRRFRGYPKKISFEVADARDLRSLKTAYFDFVLFSFNGLDCINHEDRLKSLREIRRVTKKGGYFCFSSHNLNFVWKLSIPLITNPIGFLRESYRLFRWRFLIRSEWKKLNKELGEGKYLIINSGAFKLYYVRPEDQIKQLASLCFKNIKIYRLWNGREINALSDTQNIMDAWLYYLCNV